MKKLIKIVLVMSVIVAASASFANPKCSHRLASSGNDLFKNTNPIKMKVAKATTPKSGKESVRSGIR